MFEDDDFFKGHIHTNFDSESFSVFSNDHIKSSSPSVMEVMVPTLAALVVLVAFGCLCCCLCRRRTSGRVLAPPAQPASGAAPYPQQQYTVAVATYPAHAGGVTYAPAHYPAPAPYPTATPAPYPTGAPYPTTTPYPTATPYPTPAPYPTPSAPNADAHPPPYDQLPDMKHAPYNPDFPR